MCLTISAQCALYLSTVQRSELLRELTRKGIVGTTVNAYGGSLSGSNPTDSLARTTSTRISLHTSIQKVPTALPPPKWKLALIITGAVYVALVVGGLSGSVDAMLAADMPLGLVLFVSICHSVAMLSYAGLPLVMSIPVVNKWLRLKRRCKPAEMHPLHLMLDQGLEIFSIKTKPREVPPEVLDKISKLEARVDKLLGMNTNLQARVNSLAPPADSIDAAAQDEAENNEALIMDLHINNVVKTMESHNALQREQRQDKEQSNPREGPLTMACKHYVKWEYQQDFEDWSKDMDAEMRKCVGIVLFIPVIDSLILFS